MTTAHKPTFFPAIGKEDRDGTLRGVSSQAFSARDLPGQTKLNYRRGDQRIMPKDPETLRRELEMREYEHQLGVKERQELEMLDGKSAVLKLPSNEEDRMDVDDYQVDDLDADDSSDSSEFWSSEDEMNDLEKELQKIRMEREKEEQMRKMEMAEERAEEEETRVLNSNPLLAQDSIVKKKWHEDVVFRNQAKGPPRKKRRFINDTIRNDFHKKFLAKYIQ